MLKCIAAVAVLAALAGCAAPPTAAESQAAAEPLVCRGQDECRRFWARAQTWIAQNSRWSISAASDSVISTAQPEEHSVWPGYSATRLPQTDGAERITLQVRCRNIYGCREDPYRSAASFKQYVRAD